MSNMTQEITGQDQLNWMMERFNKTKEEAIKTYNTPLEDDPELVEYVKKRLNVSNQEYEKIMSAPVRNFRDFKTYKKRFELLKPLFYVLAKANLVPMSFYLKYCFPLTNEMK